jgi:choline dehydrogenase-like flavoprotein
MPQGRGMKSTTQYDVIIVGSGAGGGMAAYALTLRGLSVLVIEAGRDYDSARESPMFQVEGDAPLHGAATPDKPFGYYDATVGGGWDIPGEPYGVAPDMQFRWWRARMLGGRTNHWGRVSLRYGPYDFCTKTRDGLGVDWPITYEQIEPYYTHVERLIGVFGAAEQIENSPDSPPGVLGTPPSPRVHELWMQMVLGRSLGIPTATNHAAILTHPLNGRPACLYATSCQRGCAIGASFQSPNVLLAPARSTGRLHLRTNAMAYEVGIDKRARATGVHYVDTITGNRHLARGRAIVLAAGSCETARILLNSKSATFPDGLANSSGQVGCNLTDSPQTAVAGDIPALQDLPPVNDDGASAPHIYVPWWAHREKNAGRLAFATEYHVDVYGGRRMPTVETIMDWPRPSRPSVYGQALRDRMRSEFGSRIALASRGGMIPNRNCRCEIDSHLKDRWGIPALRFHWKWGQQELEQASHAIESMSDMISAMGGKPIVYAPEGSALAPGGGGAMHEVGTARMGIDPGSSVLDEFGRAWDVRNLYVTDGASFCGHADKNPTETILALAWRASDHLADSFIHKEI